MSAFCLSLLPDLDLFKWWSTELAVSTKLLVAGFAYHHLTFRASIGFSFGFDFVPVAFFTSYHSADSSILKILLRLFQHLAYNIP